MSPEDILRSLPSASNQAAYVPNQTQSQPSPLARGFRAVTNVIEPLQLPQDIFFSVLGGATDGTVWDKLKQIEYKKYFDVLDFRDPDLARRPVTGEDLLRAYGFEGNVARFGGIAADLALDPLVFGTWVRAGGKALKVLGAGEDIAAGFYRVADKMDALTSIQAIPKPIRDATTKQVGHIMSQVMNIQPGRGETARTIGDFILPKTKSLNLRLGAETVNPETGLLAGTAIRLESGKAQQAAQNVEDLVYGNIVKLNEVFGKETTQNWLGRMMQSITGANKRVNQETLAVPQLLKDTILNAVYDTAQVRGASYLDDVFEGATNPLAQEFRAAQQVAKEELMNVKMFETGAPPVDLADAARLRVKQVAEANGFDPNHAQDLFNKSLKVVTEADALLGFELSGYNLIKEKFFNEIAPALGEHKANTIWRDVMAEGMRSGQVKNFEIPELDGQKFGDLIAGSESLSILDLGTFFKSLSDGHLRRSFGLFQSASGFKDYVDAVKNGKIIPTKLIDETTIADDIGGTAGQLVAQYIETIKNVSDPLRPKGFVLQQADVVKHLKDNGLAPQEIKDAVKNLVASRSSEGTKELLNKLEDLSAKYSPPPNGLPGGTGAGSFLAQRQNLTDDQLQILNEAAQPMISLFESAQFARRQLPIREFVRNTYDIAQQHGLVSSVRSGKATRLIPEGHSQFGQFAGSYVHPQLYNELYRSLEKPDKRGGIFSAIRNLTTGGLLASTSVLTANLAGGIFQHASMGVNPLAFVQSMAETLPDMLKVRSDPGHVFEDLVDMQKHFGVDAVSVVQSTVKTSDEATDLATTASRIANEGVTNNFRDTYDNVMNAWRSFLESPVKAITGKNVPTPVRTAEGKLASAPDILGLDAFQFSETWMKVAGYRAAKKVGMSKQEALEIARLGTFDYSDLPDGLRMLRDTGLLLFPGYGYFMLGRQVGTLLNHPGVLSVSDRLGDAILNAGIEDENTKYQIWASMPEWLREGDGVPVRSRTDANGNKVVSMIPLNQMVPTNVLTGAGFAGFDFIESMVTGGIYRGLAETAYAMVSGTGEAPFSKRFGQEVFSPGESGANQALQVASFLYNNFAPSSLRKLVSFNPGVGFDDFNVREDLGGLAGGLAKMVTPIPEELARIGYSYSEINRRRPDRDFADQLIASTVRSPTPISLGGATMNIHKEYESAQRRYNNEISNIKNKYKRAVAYGNERQQQSLMKQAQEKAARFQETWAEYFSAFSGGQ